MDKENISITNNNTNENVFQRLFKVDVSKNIEKKSAGNGKSLSYLSWTFAWSNVKLRYPDASYEILKFENNLPYVYDPHTGYMVFTRVTISGQTHEMWLPVMDSHNEAMLDHEYTKQYRSGAVKIPACTMFDVNKTIMRCLVKNLAMFGLGLYIYAGEDLPVDIDTLDVDIKEIVEKAESWHDRLEAVAAYYSPDIPDDNLKMIKEVCEGNSEEECEKMYKRTEAYLNKKGFKL